MMQPHSREELQRREAMQKLEVVILRASDVLEPVYVTIDEVVAGDYHPKLALAHQVLDDRALGLQPRGHPSGVRNHRLVLAGPPEGVRR